MSKARGEITKEQAINVIATSIEKIVYTSINECFRQNMYDLFKVEFTSEIRTQVEAKLSENIRKVNQDKENAQPAFAAP